MNLLVINGLVAFVWVPLAGALGSFFLLRLLFFGSFLIKLRLESTNNLIVLSLAVSFVLLLFSELALLSQLLVHFRVVQLLLLRHTAWTVGRLRALSWRMSKRVP